MSDKAFHNFQTSQSSVRSLVYPRIPCVTWCVKAMMSRACRPMLQPFLSCRSTTAARRGMSMVMGSASEGVDGMGQTPGDLPPSSSPAPAPAPASDGSSTGVVKAPRPPKEKKAPKQAPPPRIIQVAKPKKERVKDKEDEGEWKFGQKSTTLLSAPCSV